MATLSLPMSDDTVLKALAATTNYGTATDIATGEMTSATGAIHRSLLRPNFTSLGAGKTITTATLWLYQQYDLASSGATAYIYRSLRAWVETEATWNIYSTGNSWATAGSGGSGTDYDATALGSYVYSASETAWWSWSLNATEVQKLYDGTYTNNGFLLMSNVELNTGYGFNSSEHASNNPVLVVSYTSGAANISKRRGVAVASLAKVNGVAIANFSKFRGTAK